jgi:hypothetical protein
MVKNHEENRFLAELVTHTEKCAEYTMALIEFDIPKLDDRANSKVLLQDLKA